MTNEAIILAGDLGTRLKSVTKDISKPMTEVNGKPFLEYILRYLSSQDIKRIILSVGYKHKIIKDYFKEKYFDLKLIYSIEEKPLGTGGAIKKALNYSNEEDVFILNGDTLFKINMHKFYHLHKSLDSKVSISLRLIENLQRYGLVDLVDIGTSFRIINFREKEKTVNEGLINAGVYLLNKTSFLNFDTPEVFSFEKDFLEKHYKDFTFCGFHFDEYFINIGAPEDYERAKHELWLKYEI